MFSNFDELRTKVQEILASFTTRVIGFLTGWSWILHSLSLSHLLKNGIKYVCRRQEPKKIYRRRSTFGVGLDGEKWVNYLEQYSLEVEQLIKLTRNKRRFYQQGMRAATLIQSIS